MAFRQILTALHFHISLPNDFSYFKAPCSRQQQKNICFRQHRYLKIVLCVVFILIIHCILKCFLTFLSSIFFIDIMYILFITGQQIFTMVNMVWYTKKVILQGLSLMFPDHVFLRDRQFPTYWLNDTLQQACISQIIFNKKKKHLATFRSI